MNDIPGQNPDTAPAPFSGAPPANWRTAIADLIGSRAALVQLELRQAAQSGIRRTILLAAAAILILITWLIIVAGLIGLISVKGGYPWYHVALIAGGIHFIIALILVSVARLPAPPTFEITRQEFQKDREWLKNFQSPGKSND